MTNKASLRNQFLHKRDLLSNTELEKRNKQIEERLKNFLQGNHFSTIHTFLPQAGKREVDTNQLISMIRSAFPGVEILVPAIIPGTKLMNHYRLTPKTRLILNRWLIPEPDPNSSEIVNVTKIDVVLIPLLAFDKGGFRVGYGGGYYDRFLPECRPETKKTGLSFFEPIDAIDDKDQYDIPMNNCITPDEVFYW